MKTKQRLTVAVMSWFLLLLASASASAQTDTTRISELEAKMTAMAEELASLKRELAEEKQTGESWRVPVMRISKGAE